MFSHVKHTAVLGNYDSGLRDRDRIQSFIVSDLFAPLFFHIYSHRVQLSDTSAVGEVLSFILMHKLAERLPQKQLTVWRKESHWLKWHWLGSTGKVSFVNGTNLMTMCPTSHF